VVRDLRARGYRLEALVEQEATGRLATARFTAEKAAAGVLVDVLFASSGIEREVVDEAEVLELFPDLRVRVATRAHLVALKLLARDDRTRPHDRVDLVALVAGATPADLESTRRALAMITDRGYHRGKDLVAERDAFVRRLNRAGGG
jgi:hypothetical protein